MYEVIINIINSEQKNNEPECPAVLVTIDSESQKTGSKMSGSRNYVPAFMAAATNNLNDITSLEEEPNAASS